MSGNFSEENHQQLGTLRADVENVKDDVREIKDDVREMRDILLKVQGGWKTFLIFGTITASLGALFTKLAAFLIPLLPK